jgi:hypothetical protein
MHVSKTKEMLTLRIAADTGNRLERDDAFGILADLVRDVEYFTSSGGFLFKVGKGLIVHIIPGYTDAHTHCIRQPMEQSLHFILVSPYSGGEVANLMWDLRKYLRKREARNAEDLTE